MAFLKNVFPYGVSDLPLLNTDEVAASPSADL